MPDITIHLSTPAYWAFKQTAEIHGRTVEEEAKRKFSWYEENKDNEEKINNHLQHEKNRMIEKQSRAVRKNHPLQEYILEYFPETKKPKKTIAWRTCPIQPDANIHGHPTIDGYGNHVGEYWYAIRHFKKNSVLEGFCREINTSKTYYFKSLKTLKRNINKVFGYDHYKVKSRRG